MEETSAAMERYFSDLDRALKQAYNLALDARKRGFDPESSVDVPLAKNMAERVEGLISIAAPQIINSGVTKAIHQFEKKYGSLAWEVALLIAGEVSREKFCKFSGKQEAMEIGIKTGFAYHTVGVVAAPLEGFVQLAIKKRADGKEYIAAKFAGPIRGAGGTAIAVCLLILDYVRRLHGYAAYDPSEDEVNRYVTELADYHERVTNLQYKPSEEEIRYLIRHCPVEIDGDPTEEMEVSNYKDLPRVETNRIRGGVCLVVSMLALKAPKVIKHVRPFQELFGIDWSFITGFLELQKEKKRHGAATEDRISPDLTFITDLVAGRPVITYPLAHGGLRLRYGKTRASGYSAAGMHPATMAVLDKYIATGTQLKVERPGKAAAVTPCDSIDGPIVKLTDGSVLRLETDSAVRACLGNISEILYLGDFLVSYGDFYDRNHVLVPAGYCEEWYCQEVISKSTALLGDASVETLAKHLAIPAADLTAFLSTTPPHQPSPSIALALADKLGVPLHPRLTYRWGALSMEQFSALYHWLGAEHSSQKNAEKLVLPIDDIPKRSLELLGVPHTVSGNEFVILSKTETQMLNTCLDLAAYHPRTFSEKTALAAVNGLAAFTLRDTCGTFIGARMGRPEKAKMRKLTGSPHTLFPLGDAGGRLRSLQAAMTVGSVTADFPIHSCEKCKTETIFPICERCGKKTKKRAQCPSCGLVDSGACPHLTTSYLHRPIDINHYVRSALSSLGISTYPDLIKGVKGTANKDHIPEHLAKGILRAKHDIYVNKDGTTRYDMSELPLTHFTPREIGTPVSVLLKLGYEHDYLGNPLTSPTQIVELRPQDVILPASTDTTDESADAVLLRLCAFIDELLVRFYKLKPFYQCKTRQDLVGHLVVGLAPHISAGITGRIIGFSKTQAFFAHPLFHAAMRRDADGDEACVIMLMDALLNFSRTYLPASRGAKTMDSPLVLTARLVPSEVDDMVHRFDVASQYPLALYEAALHYTPPWKLDIDLLGNHLGTPRQYEHIRFTHHLSDINTGVTCSSYKTLPSMEEKLRGQMKLADRIRAVDASGVARLVIEKHLLKDIKGNLRKFSTQTFRCITCNKKYRRPPLSGICTSCNSRIIFTVSEGSVVKYLEPAISLAETYDVSPYVRQTLLLTKHRVEEVFGKDKERQEGLGKWFA